MPSPINSGTSTPTNSGTTSPVLKRQRTDPMDVLTEPPIGWFSARYSDPLTAGSDQFAVLKIVEPPIKSPRNVSPARISMELSLKARTQIGRVTMLTEALEALPDTVTDFSLEELNSQTAHVEEIHKEFLKQHAYLEVCWPSELSDHEYFRDEYHLQESRAYSMFRRVASKVKAALNSAAAARGAILHWEEAHSESKLPQIKLPKFSGDYGHWPAFRDIFTNLVLGNSTLTEAQRLHYLRGCLDGPPAQLISSLPLTEASSVVPSWTLLTSRYENKRLHVQSHLDSLYDLPTLTTKSAGSLSALITNVVKTHRALRFLGVEQNMWECMLIHHVLRHLDRSTKEAWETSLGSSQEFPSFQQLKSFLTSRAQALERVEGPASSKVRSTKAPSRKAITAHQASGSSTSVPTGLESNATDKSYPCDCCSGKHFVVVCPKFRAMGANARRQLTIDKRLCFNCLGRHSARSCRTAQRCKHCSCRHHSMLHGTQKDDGSSAAGQ